MRARAPVTNPPSARAPRPLFRHAPAVAVVPRPPSLARACFGGGVRPRPAHEDGRRRPLHRCQSYYRDDGVGGGGGGPGGGDDDGRFDRAALRQAVLILRQAQEMAQIQTRADLSAAWAADRAFAAAERDAREQGGGRDDGGGADDATRGDGGQQRLAAFFEEAGLRAYDAARLARDVRRDVPHLASRPLRDVAGRLYLLARAVPGVPAAELALCDARLLAVPQSVLVGCMVALVAAFPGADAGQMVLRCPQLVLTAFQAASEASASAAFEAAASAADGGAARSSVPACELGGDDGAAAAAAYLSSRVAEAMRTLVRLHPSGDYSVVAAAVEHEPAVLLRMRRHGGARLLDELPLEVQTAFVEADRGIGWLHKHWRRVRREEAEAAAARAAAGGGGGGPPAAGRASSPPPASFRLEDWRSVVSPPAGPSLPEGRPPESSPQSTLELDGPGSSPFESPQSTRDAF